MAELNQMYQNGSSSSGWYCIAVCVCILVLGFSVALDPLQTDLASPYAMMSQHGLVVVM